MIGLSPFSFWLVLFDFAISIICLQVGVYDRKPPCFTLRQSNFFYAFEFSTFWAHKRVIVIPCWDRGLSPPSPFLSFPLIHIMDTPPP